MATFIPDIQASQIKVPFYEDQTNSKIPGRGTDKSIASLQKEIAGLLDQLGGYNVQYTPGKYDGKPPRYGFQISFAHSGGKGRVDCVALPMRTEAAGKKDRALAQALFLVRDKFQAMAYAYVYEPGSVPLLPYMIDNKGQTVTEAMLASGAIPQLMSGR